MRGSSDTDTNLPQDLKIAPHTIQVCIVILFSGSTLKLFNAKRRVLQFALDSS